MPTMDSDRNAAHAQGMTFDQWLWQIQHSFWHMTSMQLFFEDFPMREWFDAGMDTETVARGLAQNLQVPPDGQHD